MDQQVRKQTETTQEDITETAATQVKFHCSRATSRWPNDEAPHPDAVRDGENWYLEVDTLSHLMSLSKEVDCPLIVEAEREAVNTMTGEPMYYSANLLIYDGYIE